MKADRVERKIRHHPHHKNYRYRHHVQHNNSILENERNNGADEKRSPKANHQETKCKFRKNLKRILLAINFNFPYYDSIPMLGNFYGPHFAKVVFCGPEDSQQFEVIKMNGIYGWEGYHCLAKAIEKYSGVDNSKNAYDGYFYTNDDVQLNFWNLNGDPSRVWLGAPIQWPHSQQIGKPVRTYWMWWANNTVRCERVLHRLEEESSSAGNSASIVKAYLDNYYTNTQKNIDGGSGEEEKQQRRFCIMGWSDAFYIPAKHAGSYVRLANLCERNKLFLEIASAMILHMLERDDELLNMNGMYHAEYNRDSILGFYDTYTFGLAFSHPFKLSIQVNKNFFHNIIVPYAQERVNACADVDNVNGVTFT